MENVTMRDLFREIVKLRKDVEEVKEYIYEELSAEDRKDLKKARVELKAGRTVSLEKLKRELL